MEISPQQVAQVVLRAVAVVDVRGRSLVHALAGGGNDVVFFHAVHLAHLGPTTMRPQGKRRVPSRFTTSHAGTIISASIRHGQA